MYVSESDTHVCFGVRARASIFQKYFTSSTPSSPAPLPSPSAPSLPSAIPLTRALLAAPHTRRVMPLADYACTRSRPSANDTWHALLGAVVARAADRMSVPDSIDETAGLTPASGLSLPPSHSLPLSRSPLYLTPAPPAHPSPPPGPLLLPPQLPVTRSLWSPP